MANTQLFQSTRGAFVPAAMDTNSEGAPAYRFLPKHLLAQYAATGCLNNTFYASGADQLEKVLELSKHLDAEFIAKTAVYARENAVYRCCWLGGGGCGAHQPGCVGAAVRELRSRHRAEHARLGDDQCREAGSDRWRWSFSDEVFNVVNAFANGTLSPGHGVNKIEAVLL